MTEQQFNDYLKGNSQLSERTIVAYSNQYKKFDAMNKNLITQSQTNIINFIDASETSVNTKLALYNVAVNVRKFYDKNVNKMLTRKLQTIDDYKKIKTDIKEQKLSELPTAAELISHENRLYIDGDWRGFIIVHIMRVLSTRNADLNVKIIPANRSQRKGVSGDKQNYLILRQNNAQLIRNNFKTVESYGQKKNVLPSRKLNKAIREFVAESDMELGKDDIYLLSTAKGEQLSEDSIAKKIRSHTFQSLSETDYNKIFTTKFASVKDLKALSKISENRGSSLQVLLQEYHLET